jgi:hypothetical protein
VGEIKNGVGGTYIQIPGNTIAHVWSMVLSMGKRRARRTPLVMQVLVMYHLLLL